MKLLSFKDKIGEIPSLIALVNKWWIIFNFELNLSIKYRIDWLDFHEDF